MNARCAVALAAALVLTLTGCDLPGRPRAADRPVLPSQVTAFGPLYGRHCAGCHGADGRLGAARPLNDPVYLALIPPDRLRRTISQGVPGTPMPAFATAVGGVLTAVQVDALVAGMLTRWARPEAVKGLALPPYDAEDAVARGSGPGDPRRGADVYRVACARCHGSDGKGGPQAGPVVDDAYLALASDQALRTVVIAGRADLGKPDWREDVPGQPLGPQQISDVVAWLTAQRRPVAGRPVSGADPGRPQP